MKKNKIKPALKYSSNVERKNYDNLLSMMINSPMSKQDLFSNLGLFQTRTDLSKFLFLNDIYTKILNNPGVVMEFGVRWGQNLTYFQSLRSIYEPFNTGRKIIGFDTFKGFPKISKKDGKSKSIKKGTLNVTKNYREYLNKLLLTHEKLSPRANIKKFEIVQGDVSKTLPKYLKRNPQTIVSMAFFDLTLYHPTKKTLKAIKPYLTKNSLIVFDQLNLEEFPGETLALKEIFGLNKYKLFKSPFSTYQTYLKLR